MNKPAKRYVECARCQGTGRFDRGTCFGCKGCGVKVQARKPKHLVEWIVTATKVSGEGVMTWNIFAGRMETAAEIIARGLRVAPNPTCKAESVWARCAGI